MSTTEEKLYFLRQVEKQDPHQILQIIQDSILHKGRIRYDDIVLSHAHSTGFLDDTKSGHLLKKMYKLWYQVLYRKLAQDTYLTDSDKQKVKEILRNPKLNYTLLQYKNNVDYSQLFSNIIEQYDYHEVPKVQGEGSFIEHYNTFLHVDSKSLYGVKLPDRIELRLYLNLKSSHLVQFVDRFIGKMWEQKTPFYIKYSNDDYRNDTFLMYTDYAIAPYMVQVIKNITHEYPELFEGSAIVNPLMTSIDGYIGIGEEPILKHTSFNSIRTEFLNSIVEEKRQEILFQVLKTISLDAPRMIHTSTGLDLDLEAYIEYMIRSMMQKHYRVNMVPSYVVTEMKQQIKNEILLGQKIDGEYRLIDDTGKTVKVDLKNLPIIEKLCSVYRIPYQDNSISMLGNLEEAMYGASIKPEYWEKLKQKTKEILQNTMIYIDDDIDITDQEKKNYLDFYSVIKNRVAMQNVTGRSIVKMVAGKILENMKKPNMRSYIAPDYFQAYWSGKQFCNNTESAIGKNIDILPVMMDIANIQLEDKDIMEKYTKYCDKYDIPNNPSYFFLNGTTYQKIVQYQHNLQNDREN